MASEIFEAPVALLVRTLPYVAAETCFALKLLVNVSSFRLKEKGVAILC
jgi:hypothetical protein